jgi:hypothetical protein
LQRSTRTSRGNADGEAPVVEYARRPGVDRALISPLLVARRAGYTAELLFRMVNKNHSIGDETWEWIAGTRLYALWRYVSNIRSVLPGSVTDKSRSLVDIFW